MEIAQTREQQGIVKSWSQQEESVIARIMRAESCSRMEAVRRMRRRGLSDSPVRVCGTKQDTGKVGNVSPEADAEFMRLLEKEDPQRYERLMRNVRQQNPVMRMSEEQAAANFILGLPTGQHRFVIVAGKNVPVSKERERVDYLLHNGTAEEWAKAIVALAHSDSPAPTITEPTPTKINGRKAGRPKVYRSSGERQDAYRRRLKVGVVTK